MELTLRWTSLEIASRLRRLSAPLEVAPAQELTRRLARGQTFTIERPAKLRFECLAGTLWITHDGDPKDVVLDVDWARSSMAVHWLVAHGLDLEERDALGRTPLLHAALKITESGRTWEEVVAAMISAGADPEACDHEGRSAAATLTASRKRIPNLQAILRSRDLRASILDIIAEGEAQPATPPKPTGSDARP